MSGFEFMMPGKIVFGAGKLAETGTLVKQFGNKTMIVCDEWTAKSGLTGKLQSILKTAGIDAVIFSGVIPNPTAGLIDIGAAIARKEKIDFVIGLGGGSSMDAAKGIAVAATHPGSIWSYAIGNSSITDVTLPIVAITTTSGTGSQCTCFAVISNPETKQKPGMGSPYVLPRLAIIDPELMLSAPARLTLVTGFDVFSHAVEAYTSTAASELSDIYAEKALRLLGKALPIVCADGNNLEARTEMALADTCAGIAICNAVVSLGHVIAHVISGHHADIAHGDALYSIYREVLKVNSKALHAKHKFIANCLQSDNDDVVSAFDNFFSGFKFENRLKSKHQEDPGLVDRIAKDTFTYMKGITELNPVNVDEKSVREILTASLNG